MSSNDAIDGNFTVDNSKSFAVRRIGFTAVKGTAIREVPEATVIKSGIPGDRQYFVVDDQGRLVNGRRAGRICQLASSFDAVAGQLTITRGGELLNTEEVNLSSQEYLTNFYDHDVRAIRLSGRWSTVLTDYFGSPHHLVSVVAPDLGVDLFPMTVVGTGSLECVASAVGVPVFTAWRRFRTSIEIDGLPPHVEDGWAGRTLKIGDVVIRINSRVPRCVVPQQDPTTGEPDSKMLKELLAHHHHCSDAFPGTELHQGEKREAEFAVYATVETEGVIHCGDTVCIS